MNKQDKLFEKIHAAFDGCSEVPERVTEYPLNDPEDYDGEGESVEQYYGGRNWKEVDFRNVGGFLISYLKVDALLYYLPAILIAILRYEKPNTDFTDRAFSAFGDPKRFDEKIEQVRNALNFEQKLVLVEVFSEVNSWNNWYSNEIKFIREKFGHK